MGITRGLHRYDKRKGHSGRQAPTTTQGALMSLRAVRLYCGECQTVQSVKEVSAVEQHPQSYSAAVILGCGHGRTVTVAVKRPKTETEQEVIGEDNEISRTIDQAV